VESFRTEIENLVVTKDIIDLEQKIFAFKNNNIDEEKFRSLRLARGVYGQRQQGVQMVRIKIPYGKFSSKQLLRISDVADRYSNGNLHITTRQDIQIHHVDLEKTPQLWAELEKDDITLREACGNTVRNVTASPFAGIDPDEPFDVSPYAQTFFSYFLRNPICQDMGRKIKIAFSSSKEDHAYTFVHDIGFIPKIKDQQHGFKVVVGGGIGSQPRLADCLYDFLPANRIIPVSEAILRLFDRFGERNRRNKARLKFLIKELGFDAFVEKVQQMERETSTFSYPIDYIEHKIASTIHYPITSNTPKESFERWKNTNVFPQKQKGLVAVGLCIQTGDLPTQTARKLAGVIDTFCGEDARFTVNQGILLRSIQFENLEALYEALVNINLDRIGFDRINDIVACPGTDTCNLGIASSMGLAKELQHVLEHEFQQLIDNHKISIKISGCMNACGQHTIADIGFQGMTLKSNGKIAPATQILLGGGAVGNADGHFADKVLKVPSKRTPDVLRWLLIDFENHHHRAGESFMAYYQRVGSDYFYQNLKHFSEVDNLQTEDFIDWGNEQLYEKAIGVGECAGVTIDLVQTLLFDAEEFLENAESALAYEQVSNAVYFGYSALIRGAKAILTTVQARINSHHSIIVSFGEHFPNCETDLGFSFRSAVKAIENNDKTNAFAKDYIAKAKAILNWIKNEADAR
jgi:sulfite reductase (ferredoxin)